jgi:hypothetical protein
MKLKISLFFSWTEPNQFCARKPFLPKPSASILELADYERAPSVSMDTKRIYVVDLQTYKSLDDLNQDELRLGGLRINPITNISSAVTYVNNLKLRKIKIVTAVAGLPENLASVTLLVAR